LYPLKLGYIELFGAKNSDIAMAIAKRHYLPKRKKDPGQLREVKRAPWI
jgi:hypothetical protein